MKLKSLAIVVAILAVLSAIAYRANRPEAPAASDPRAGKPVADAAAIEKAQKLHITDQGKSMIFTRQPDGSWRDDDYYGFPADFSKLSGFVADLTGAKVERLVTSSPDRIARLEFKDTKIEFLDSADHPLWSVTLGKIGESGGRFVRFDDEPKAYFASLNLWLDMEPKGWANTVLLDLKADDLAKIEIPDGPGGPLLVSRAKKGDPWTADKTPAGQQVKADKVGSLAAALGGLHFSDTADLADPKAAEAKAGSRTFKLTTFDGRTVAITLGRKAEEKKLKAAGKEAEAKPAASQAADGKPPAPAKSPEPEYETIPAGPVFAWISSSDEKAPVNALMKKRAFQVDDSVFTGLPQKADELFEPIPPAAAKQPEEKPKAP